MHIPNKILFPFLPFVATNLQFYDLVFRNRTVRTLLTFEVFLCLYLSFVNCSIDELGVDLAMYKGYFEYATSHSFLNVLNIRDFREVLFYAYVYVFNKLLFGNWWLFLCLTTFLTSWLMLSALLRLCKAQNLSIALSAIALYLAALNPDHFIWTNHLMRQFLALSMFIYGFTFLSTNLKYRKWIAILFLILAFYVHTSMGFLGAIAIISYLTYQVLTSILFPRGAVRVFIFILLLFGIFAIFLVFAPTLLTYVFSDISQSFSVYGGSQIIDSTGIDARSFTYNNVALLIGSFISVICIVKRPTPFYTIYSIFFLIYAIIMVSLLSMPWFGLVAYRLSVNIFGLMFIFIPLLFTRTFAIIPFQKYTQLMVLFSTLISFRFFYTLSRSSFDFGESFWLLSNPLILNIAHSFSL